MSTNSADRVTFGEYRIPLSKVEAIYGLPETVRMLNIDNLTKMWEDEKWKALFAMVPNDLLPTWEGGGQDPEYNYEWDKQQYHPSGLIILWSLKNTIRCPECGHMVELPGESNE